MMGLGGIALITIVLLALMVPILVLVAAMHGGAALPKIVIWVAYLTAVFAALAAAAKIASFLSGGEFRVTVPVEPLPVKVPAGVTFDPPPVATLVGAETSQVDVLAEGFSWVTRWELSASWLLGAATIIAVCVVVLRLSRALARFDPFTVGAKALTALGWIVLVGWTLAEVLGQMGAASASADVFLYGGATLPPSWGAGQGPTDHGWPVPRGYSLSLPWEPLGAALAFALLAAVFRHGERLRRDTDGLV
jgi:hypothetical protein